MRTAAKSPPASAAGNPVFQAHRELYFCFSCLCCVAVKVNDVDIDKLLFRIGLRNNLFWKVAPLILGANVDHQRQTFESVERG